ncbi:MAG: rod shape-determining protein MreC [Saccharofermentans sp.]|nr:rod shape-determining protein MreC [Saccharofermentans sp.]
MKRLLTSKLFIVIMAVLLILAAIILSVVPGSPLNTLMKPVGGIIAPVQRLVKDTGNGFSDFWAAINDGIAIRNENRELKAEIAELQYQITQNEEAMIRYEELRDAFHIRDTFSNYDIYGASILSREADEWFSVIRIGLGNRDGVELEKGDSLAVVDVRMNLIGRIIEVNGDDSKILPLLHEGFIVNAKVNEVNGANLTVMGDASLKHDGLCLVTDIDANVELEPGTEIVTSGNGGLFPQGIPIGVIVSVDKSNPTYITATLRPYSDIGTLNDVFVMVPFEKTVEATEEAD